MIGLKRERPHYRLVRRRGDDGMSGASSGPFVTLGDREMYAQAFLARLHQGDTPLGPPICLLIEPNSYAGIGGLTPFARNPKWESAWDLAYATHAKARSEGVAGLLEEGLASAESRGRAPRHPPVSYCPKVDLYLSPVCPTCRGPLTTCRDEALLRSRGLPSYRQTLHRFLHCAACAEGGIASLSFYTFSLETIEGLTEGTRLRHRMQLYRDLSPQINGDVSSPPDDVPCFVCPHRTECYPPGSSTQSPVPAERILFPVAYYDFQFIPVEPTFLEFEDTSALLGGASVDVIGDHARHEFAARHYSTAAGPQFFFQKDRVERFILEVLYLKIASFARMADGLLSVYREAGRPHLALAPDRVRAVHGGGSANLPARWCLSLKLADLVSTASVEEDGSGKPTAWAVPQPVSASFMPEPMLREQIQRRKMRFDVQDFQLERGGGESVGVIIGDLSSDQHHPGDWGKHDIVQLTVLVPDLAEGRLLFVGGIREFQPRGGRFEGRTRPLKPEEAEAVSGSETFRNAILDVMITRAFSTPCDIMGLGVLLLRMLLWNEKGTGGRLDLPLIDRVVGEAESHGSPSREGPSDFDRIRRALEDEEIPVDPTQVLYKPRGEVGEQDVVWDLWRDSILLGFRMASLVPGWSVCRGLDDYDPEQPARALEGVVQQLNGLADRARGLLLRTKGKNRLVLEVCRDFVADLREAERERGRPRGTVSIT